MNPRILAQALQGFDPSPVMRARVQDERLRFADEMRGLNKPMIAHNGVSAAIQGLMNGYLKYKARQGHTGNLEDFYSQFEADEQARSEAAAQAQMQASEDAQRAAQAKRVADLEDYAIKQQMQAQYNPRKGVTVNTGNTGPQIGSIPQGYQARMVDGAYRMEPIPGGPAAQELQNQADKKVIREANQARSGTTVLQDINRAIGLLDDAPDDDGLLGSVGGATARLGQSVIPGTASGQIAKFKESALSNVGLDTLQAMREASPTGGALGQVPIQQQQRLEQVLGSLDLGQPRPDLEANMKRVFNVYVDIVYGSQAERDMAIRDGQMTPDESAQIDGYYYDLPFDALGNPVSQDNSVPQGIDPGVWEFMTDEEKALFR